MLDEKIQTQTYEDEIGIAQFLRELAPLHRTLACQDTDEALSIVCRHLKGARIESFPCGSKAWSWVIPPRWELKRGTISANGKVLVDSDWHHLHVVNYSQPFKGKVSHDDLMRKIFHYAHLPDSIPFIANFYKKDWGFCIPHDWLSRFNQEFYDVELDATFEIGNFNLASFFLPGEFNETFVICSNVCHPTQVNDSLTGLAVAIDIARRLQKRKSRKYSYLILAVPETIGSVVYFAHHADAIQKCIGGFFCEMVGTNGPFVLQTTRRGNSYWDAAMKQVLSDSDQSFQVEPFLKYTGNDEKVMDSPGVDIPTFSLTRTPYPEYHSSKDNIQLIDEVQIRKARDILQSFVDIVETDYIPQLNQPGPIFLSGYDLYPDWVENPNLLPKWHSFRDVMYAIDGISSLVEIAAKIQRPLSHVRYWCDAFAQKNLLSKKNHRVTRT